MNQEKMRSDWDERARTNHRFYIATGAAASQQAFLQSGRNDLDIDVLDGIDLQNDSRVLEIGAGIGRMVVPLSYRVAHVIGVDISPAMIARSAEYCADRENVLMTVTDGELPAKDESLDFIYSYIVFQHVPELSVIADYCKEAHRVLRPGGVFRFQVDGRVRVRDQPGFLPGTYDGVKVDRLDILRFLADTSFEIAGEWGEDTHYYWVTAMKKGVGARVSVHPRALSGGRLEEVFIRCGVADTAQAVRSVLGRKTTIRRVLSVLEGTGRDGEDESFVTNAFSSMLAGPPPPGTMAFHVALLKSADDDRAGVIDSLVVSREFKDLVCPLLPKCLWYRVEGAFEATGANDRTLRDDARAFELMYRLSEEVRGLTPAAALRRCFSPIVGHSPDQGACQHYEDLIASRGAYRFIEALLVEDDRPPMAPPAERADEVERRCGLPRSPRRDLLPGESFPGERDIARGLLDGLRGADSAEFVRAGFRRILGRDVDTESVAYYVRKLEAREMNRPLFLRELLWSDELRRA